MFPALLLDSLVVGLVLPIFYVYAIEARDPRFSSGYGFGTRVSHYLYTLGLVIPLLLLQIFQLHGARVPLFGLFMP